MEIKPLTIRDYGEVHRLWLRTPGVGLNALDDSRQGIEKFIDRNPDSSFVAIIDGRIVGVILCGHDGRRGHIYHMAVDERERCRGVGGALLDAAMAALEAEGITKATLVVFADNESGNRFWEKRGFSVRDDLVYRNRTIGR